MQQTLSNKCFNAAIKMLARREHSVSELTEKLSIKGFELKDINSAVQSLIEKNLQSDERYCEMLIRSRANKQSGPFKVRMELKQKGINEGLIERALQECDCDWFESARQAAEKKSANWREKDAEHKAKLMRFLQGRGFDGEQVRYAVEACGY